MCFSFIKVKYDELLQRYQHPSDVLSHKAVQTSSSPVVSSRTRSRLSSSSTVCELTLVLEEGQPPEYKALFNQIFTCIKKTKEDLSENRRQGKNGNNHGNANNKSVQHPGTV